MNNVLDNLLIQITNVKDAAGDQAFLTETPVWKSSNSTIFDPAVSLDGMSATGQITKAGAVTVTVTSGAISASVDLTAAAGVAVSFELSVPLQNPPVPQPPPNEPVANS